MLETVAVLAVLLAIAVAGVMLLASRRPDTFAIERSALIMAPPERIYPLIADLRTLNTWNPFAADASITMSYSGPSIDKGATYDFASPRAGTGRFEITDTRPPSLITARLVMTKPFACDNRVEYRLVPEGPATRVTWHMSGHSTLMSKVMGLAMDPDKMVGGMFLKGLADLKTMAESKQQAT